MLLRWVSVHKEIEANENAGLLAREGHYITFLGKNQSEELARQYKRTLRKDVPGSCDKHTLSACLLSAQLTNQTKY